MTNAIITTNNDTAIDISVIESIKNETLRSKTSEIAIQGLNARKAALHIAALVAEVKANKDEWCVEFDGKTATDKFVAYGAKYLGVKKAQLFAMANVGANLIADDKRSIIAHDNDIDYTMTQLQKLVTLPTEVVKQLDANGEISPDMTAKEIADVAFKHDEKAQERKAKAKARKEAKEAKEATGSVKAEKLFDIALYRIEDGSLVLNLNGEDVTKTTDKDVRRIMAYIIKNAKHLTK